MIKNRGLGLLAEVAADEDYYPVRRRGQKRRLNPNWAAIEWLENDTLDLTEERSRYLMSDTGGRYALNDTRDDLIAVTRTYGSTLGTHFSRPMFECFGITGDKGSMSYSNPCPDCYNFAYSSHGCGGHADVVSNYISELDQITAPTIRGLSATMTGADGAQVAVSWRVNPS